MRIKVTKPGIYGAKGEIAVGTELTVKDEPKAWKGRYEILGEATSVAVTNPASGAVVQPVVNVDRQALLAEAAKVLDAEHFSAEGVPDVREINALLDEGVAKFSAAERDQLWPGIADAVKADRG